MEEPIPLTFRIASTVAKGRASTIFCAVLGPIPGNVTSSSSVAVLILIWSTFASGVAVACGAGVLVGVRVGVAVGRGVLVGVAVGAQFLKRGYSLGRARVVEGPSLPGFIFPAFLGALLLLFQGIAQLVKDIAVLRDVGATELDAAIVFAPVGALVPAALKAVRKGGRVVCGGIHSERLPSTTTSSK